MHASFGAIFTPVGPHASNVWFSDRFWYADHESVSWAYKYLMRMRYDAFFSLFPFVNLPSFH